MIILFLQLRFVSTEKQYFMSKCYMNFFAERRMKKGDGGRRGQPAVAPAA